MTVESIGPIAIGVVALAAVIYICYRKVDLLTFPLFLPLLCSAAVVPGALLGVNCYLRDRLEQEFATYQPKALADLDDRDAIAQVCVSQGWAGSPDVAYDWNTEVKSLSAQIASLAGEIGEAPNAEAQLRDACTGTKRGKYWWLGQIFVQTENPSGPDIVTKMGDAEWRQMASSGKLRFLENLCEELISGVAERRRWLQRLNGPIQWLIYALTIFLILAALGRAVVMWISPQKREKSLEPIRRETEQRANLGHDWIPELRNAVSKLESRIEEKIYEPFHFLAGIIPSLGFVGTVWGMGEALLGANAIFGDGDPKRAMSEVTQDLGYAFDTTLVALVASILVGLAVYGARAVDKRKLLAFERETKKALETGK